MYYGRGDSLDKVQLLEGDFINTDILEDKIGKTDCEAVEGCKFKICSFPDKENCEYVNDNTRMRGEQAYLKLDEDSANKIKILELEKWVSGYCKGVGFSGKGEPIIKEGNGSPQMEKCAAAMGKIDGVLDKDGSIVSLKIT